MAAASATTTDQTPATAEIEVAPQAVLGQKRKVEARQDEQRHQEIDRHHDDERQSRQRDGGAASLDCP